MAYRTKKEVLEALGKNEKDVRYLDRAIARGEVVVEGGGYIIMKEYISNLQRKVRDLERQLQKEIERNEGMGSIVQAKSVLDEEDRKEYLKQIHDLEMENGKLNKELAELEQKNGYLERQLEGVGSTSSESELEEAKIQWKYYEEKTNKYKKAIEKVIHVTYNTIKPKLGSKLEDEHEFRESILQSVSELLSDDD